ncbi:MAG: hypothetical protein K6A92_11020 [Lachnospiraceae bacterium]|nr:hypothetical protein [Lachnospiraceae bacterium]
MQNVLMQSSAKHRKWIILLWIGAALANIKSIFADYDRDLSYALVTTIRHLNGDRLFQEMGEPHQTSAFLLDALAYLFRKVTSGRLDGIVIYLNICGVFLYLGICLYLVKVLKQHTDPVVAELIGILFFAFRVRQIVMPEFTNMLVGFSTLLFAFLIRHLQRKKDRLYLVLAALLLCLLILSYPSGLLVYFAVAGILFFYGEDRKRDILLLTAICMAFGCIYVLYFSAQAGGVLVFLQNLQQIVTGDASHGSGNAGGVLYYVKETLAAMVWIAASLIVSLLLNGAFGIIRKKRTPRWRFWLVTGICLIVTDQIFCTFLDDLIPTGSLRYVYGGIFVLLILLGAKGYKNCTSSEKQIWSISVILSIAVLLAVSALTNQVLITSLQYLVLAGSISLIPGFRYLEAEQDSNPECKAYPYAWIGVVALLIVLHRGIIMRDYGEASSTVWGIRNIVKSGPTMGVLSSYMSAYMTGCNQEDWTSYVPENSRILVVGPELYDPIVYLYQNTEICHYSTIDTPTYDENLLAYWGKYPEKKPEIIAIECWYGELHVEEESWIMGWVREHCDLIGDGRYWRFCRVRE